MHISSQKLGIAAVCFIALILALPAMAQNCTFRGKVTDVNGEPIKGATVIIQSVDTKSRTFTLKTDKKGTFVYVGLPGGLYHVGARAEGYSPRYQPNTKASMAEDAQINIQLPKGPDQKMPFELTPEELKRQEAEMEKAKKRQESSVEVQALFDEGTKLAEEGKHAEAIEKFKLALAKDPEQTNIMGNMAESYRKLDKFNEALEIYQKAIAIKPNDPVLYTNMGVVLNKLGKTTESQEAFKKAASLNPGGSAESYYNLGVTMFNSGKTTEAIEPFKQAIAADPNYADAYFQLGMCQSNQPDTMEEAIRNLKKYTEIGKNPGQVETAKAIISALEQSMKKK
jgi:tetratricopeptide (TPR) repeat protein